MRLNNLPFQRSLKVPLGISSVKTSNLLGNGLFFFCKDPGLPYQSPLGRTIFGKLKKLVLEEHQRGDFSEIKIPGFMRREILEDGETLEESFRDKLITLPEPMNGYILLTTHEMDTLDYLSKEKLSHRNLPLRVFSSNQLLRPLRDPKGILRCREFEVVMALSVDNDEAGFRGSLGSYGAVSEFVFNRLGIPVRKCVNETGQRDSPHAGFDLEYFYRGTEGDNLVLDPEEGRIKALSLSMGYRFRPQRQSLRVASTDNTLVEPVIGTYAMGLERLMYAVFDASRDEAGFDLPAVVRPFDVSILVFPSSSGEEFRIGMEIYDKLRNLGTEVLLDDRGHTKRVERGRFSDYLGIPQKVIVTKSGIFRVNRKEEKGERFNSLEGAVDYYS